MKEIEMENLKVKISKFTKRKFQIKGNEISFKLLEDKIRTTLLQEQLDRTVRAAQKAGLSRLTKKEINAIIYDVRRSA